MQFGAPSRKPVQETTLPMINVVFLLLIFFLMSAQIAPPDPFAIDPPQSSAEQGAEGVLTLYLSAAGELGFEGQRGEAALRALQIALQHDGSEAPRGVRLRADAEVPAARLARLLPQLAEIGAEHLQLVTGAQ